MSSSLSPPLVDTDTFCSVLFRLPTGRFHVRLGDANFRKWKTPTLTQNVLELELKGINIGASERHATVLSTSQCRRSPICSLWSFENLQKSESGKGDSTVGLWCSATFVRHRQRRVAFAEINHVHSIL